MKKVLAVAIILALACTSVFALTISVGFSSNDNIVTLIKAIPEMDGIKDYFAYQKSHRAWFAQISGDLYSFGHEPINEVIPESGIAVSGDSHSTICGSFRIVSEYGNFKKIGSVAASVGFGQVSVADIAVNTVETGEIALSMYDKLSVGAGVLLEFKNGVNPKFIINLAEEFDLGYNEMPVQFSIYGFNLGLVLGKDSDTGKFSVGTYSDTPIGVRPLFDKHN